MYIYNNWKRSKPTLIGVCETRRARAVSARWTSGEEILLGEGAKMCPEQVERFQRSCRLPIGRYGIPHRKKKAKRLWTWRSSDTRTLRQIDYVLTDTPRLGKCDNDWLRSSAFAFGDPLRCQERTQRTLVRQTFNADMYAAMIESSDLHMNTGSNIDADYEDLVGKITQAVKASSIAIEPARRRRISTETLQMMKRRARMKAEGRVQNEEYRTLCEAIRERIKCDYEGYRQMKLREAAEKRASLKAVERDIRLRQHIPYALKDDTGVRTTNRPRMNEICTKFYNDLYSSKVVVARTYRNVAEEPIPEVMWEEVENAVKQIKAGKSPGCDNIRPEHLKAGGLHLFKALAE
ncbi:hypothetical protein OSTOST_02104, partial [Ostertagia ostertagi]